MTAPACWFAVIDHDQLLFSHTPSRTAFTVDLSGVPPIVLPCAIGLTVDELHRLAANTAHQWMERAHRALQDERHSFAIDALQRRVMWAITDRYAVEVEPAVTVRAVDLAPSL